MKKDFLPSRFLTLRATAPTPVSWEDIVREIRDGRHATATRNYRENLHRLASLPDGSPQADELKRRKEQLKSSQPAFTPSVSLEGGRSSRHITGYSGHVMVDIDGLDTGTMGQALALVRDDPHTFLAYTTLSGRGIRVIARVGGVDRKADFDPAWRQVNTYYAQLTHTDIDQQCKNATRMSAICHDPDVLFRPDADIFPLKTPAARKNPAGRPPQARKAASTVRRLVEESGVRYEAHHHNDYISRCLYWMNRFGVPCEDAERWALDTFADYEAGTRSVASIVRSCYARTDEHATERLAKYRTRQDSAAGAARRASVKELEAFIDERVSLRMNTLTQILEYRPADAAPGDAWLRMTDQVENTLWCDMQRAGIHADLLHIRTLLGSNFVEYFHPLRAYLDSLAPWDGKTDYIGQTANRVQCSNLNPSEFSDYFRHWLVGMLAGALDERVVNHVILVFIGRQGCFKSSFMEHLLPPCLRQYYTSKTNSQRLTKDDLFAMTENLVINFEEIDSMQRADLNQLKAMTTTLHINERPAYGRNKVRLPHVTSFCATGNNTQFLNDDTGTRRWLVAEIDRIENPWNSPLPYEGLYAQAKALLEGGYQYWFDEKEIAKIIRRNRRFETPNAARELVPNYYRKPVGLEKGRYLTSYQIVQRFGRNVRLNPVQVGKVLREMGCEQVHTRNGNYWILVERSVQEISSILPSPIILQEKTD